MFRLSHILRSLLKEDKQVRIAQNRLRPVPVVVWNLLRRCNLNCLHCYSASSDRDFSGELTTSEAMAVLDDLAQLRVPALILSGGEPLLRPDLFELAAAAKSNGLYVALSTNGLLAADAAMAERIAGAAFDYVGVSLDGLEMKHDLVRGQYGAFRQTMQGIRQLLVRGLNVGLRFTMTQDNITDLPGLLERMATEGVTRLYLSHLNYAGRGHANREQDTTHEMTRHTLRALFDLCLKESGEAQPIHEIVTGNNDADAPFFLQWVADKLPEKQALAEAILRDWGGNASGVGIANIDNRGFVHPDIFWWNHTLGNVRERPFSEIWYHTADPLLEGLRQRPRPVEGRCASCRYLSICGGNTRVRAHQTTGNPWAADPGCYLTDQEIQ